jgi:hypothetical protein
MIPNRRSGFWTNFWGGFALGCLIFVIVLELVLSI